MVAEDNGWRINYFLPLKDRVEALWWGSVVKQYRAAGIAYVFALSVLGLGRASFLTHFSQFYIIINLGWLFWVHLDKREQSISEGGLHKTTNFLTKHLSMEIGISIFHQE